MMAHVDIPTSEVQAVLKVFAEAEEYKDLWVDPDLSEAIARSIISTAMPALKAENERLRAAIQRHKDCVRSAVGAPLEGDDLALWSALERTT